MATSSQRKACAGIDKFSQTITRKSMRKEREQRPEPPSSAVGTDDTAPADTAVMCAGLVSIATCNTATCECHLPRSQRRWIQPGLQARSIRRPSFEQTPSRQRYSGNVHPEASGRV